MLGEKLPLCLSIFREKKNTYFAKSSSVRGHCPGKMETSGKWPCLDMLCNLHSDQGRSAPSTAGRSLHHSQSPPLSLNLSPCLPFPELGVNEATQCELRGVWPLTQSHVGRCGRCVCAVRAQQLGSVVAEFYVGQSTTWLMHLFSLVGFWDVPRFG